jgi:hypothetical protein
VSPAEALELVEQLVRRACALPPDDAPLAVDKLELADYVFQLCQFTPPDNITLPQGCALLSFFTISMLILSTLNFTKYLMAGWSSGLRSRLRN